MSSLKNKNKAGKKPEDYCIEFRVLAKLYEYINVKKKPIWFSRLARCFRGKFPKWKISQAEDRLYDMGWIDKKFKMAEGLWTSCYIIEDDVVSFAEVIYENI
jgi:hypothetical protein